MEGDVVVLQDIYVFDFSLGIDDEGKFRGQLKCTGIRPSFSERLADYGISLEPALFSSEHFARKPDVAMSATSVILAVGDVRWPRLRGALRRGGPRVHAGDALHVATIDAGKLEQRLGDLDRRRKTSTRSTTRSARQAGPGPGRDRGDAANGRDHRPHR